jgi:hypothetical protein
VRYRPDGLPVGLDLAAALALAGAMGAPAAAVAELLPYAEAGAVTGMRQRYGK